jgi:hypothetical protein
MVKFPKLDSWVICKRLRNFSGQSHLELRLSWAVTIWKQTGHATIVATPVAAVSCFPIDMTDTTLWFANDGWIKHIK